MTTMLQLSMTKQKLILLFLILLLLILPSGVLYVKNNQLNLFKHSSFINTINQTDATLKTIIKEKQNTTTTIALSLSNNESIKNYLKDQNNYMLDLHQFSLQLRKTTTFKNVWFQLIDKHGISLQRSWNSYKGDRIADSRLDLQKMIKNPKTMNTISVGKFDMTFKSMTPIFEDDTFLGIIEVITHFNSIDQKLKEKGIESLILADISYEKQITKPFSQKFIQGYYIANKSVNPILLKQLQQTKIPSLIKELQNKHYIVNEETNQLFSYYQLQNINHEPMGHFILVHQIEKLDLSKISKIEYFYNIILILTVLILVILFYFNYNLSQNENNKYLISKVLTIVIGTYITLSLIIYFIINEKYNNDIKTYQNTIKHQTLLKFHSIKNNIQTLSKLIFISSIDKPNIKTLFKEQKREALFNALKDEYNKMVQQYHVRQIHFHLPNNTSFLRMHKPNFYGDFIKDIRQSVEYVNEHQKQFSGFEEGRIYNGYRNVYPLFIGKEYIGSLEVSFDIYSFVERYLKDFNTERVNLLINTQLINKKVFKSQQSNYIPSPVDGFSFDTLVLNKLKNIKNPIKIKEKAQENLNVISKKIYLGKPFITYFENINELTTSIPIVNRLNGEIIGSFQISRDASYLQNRKLEFLQLMATILIVLAFLMVFIYREIILKYKFNEEFKKNQIILDSQQSFILITDGKELKTSNNSMLHFVGFDNLKEFKQHYDCICEFFIPKQGYLQKTMGDLTWFEYILKNLDKDHLALIKDKNNKEHIFLLQINTNNKINEHDYIVTFIDITTVKNMEQQLIQNEKMASLGSMIGNIAHQWRQPLSVITTLASGIQVKREYHQFKEEDLDDVLESIIKNANYLSETIDTFRDFLHEDKIEKDYIIQELIAKTLNILNASLQNNNIKLVNSCNSKKDIHKTMPSGELSQVITNIINNAKDILILREIKDATITITCEQNEISTLIYIEDNGGGVDQSIQDKIFEPYFTTKHQSQGT
ncbi:MAG TPA: hypothetical protein ENK66_07730, partial [Arcobacter sp.]|nr:hypothetical protein [Arcobacter sp.]